MCARRRSNFLLLRQKKVTKEKATLQSATPSRCEGANLRRGACGVRRITHCAPAALRSNKCGESVYASMRAATRMPTPQAPRRRRSQKGFERTRAIAALGLASAARSACDPGGRAQRWPVGLLGWHPPFRMRRGAQRPADQGSRLSERRRREFERDPAGREHRRLPAAKRRDAASGVAFSLVTFFWRDKRK